MKNIFYLCSKNNLIFQVHGNSDLSLNKQKEYIDILNELSCHIYYPINMVIHPIYNSDKQKSIDETINYTNAVSRFTSASNIILSLENLNDACNQDRLNKEDITPIVCNNESLFFTYDIGHEIIENGNITDLNEFMIPLISNVHIHTYNSKYKDGYDHKPINQGDEHWNKCLKGIYFLKNNHYDGNIVFEYDLYQCFGDNIEEKIKSYLASIDNFSDRFN